MLWYARILAITTSHTLNSPFTLNGLYIYYSKFAKGHLFVYIPWVRDAMEMGAKYILEMIKALASYSRTKIVKITDY